MPRIKRGFDPVAAAAHLERRDRKLATWMRKVGPLPADARWRKSFDVVDALARAILYQQLAGAAAATIVGRVERAAGEGKLHADALSRIDDATLRGCGVSGNKALALRDLSTRALRGEVPSLREMSGMPDEEIIASLTAVRGIGRWTVQMMLMFRLGRADQLPIDDLGIRKGVQVIDRLDDPPMPRALLERGERWGPYRTYASMYLWRIADLSAQRKTPAKRSQE